ncbi:MAG: hypothetical protein ACI8S3_001547 [Alphaproteobacteria bacterium]|jgi:hypothetical protein
MSASEQKNSQVQSNAAQPPSYEELVRLVGELEPARLAEIELLHATINEIEEAVAFASGEDDVMGEARIPLIGRAAEVYEIITSDAATDEER